ncbi:hypothetical protein VNO80_22122 [Phaseolus coccineus]|uniref:Uncharacterized protein n=1 Tax=Phaseolus coccineus TaxID=3886 RepID=A0AAN9M911_PHACN
MVLDIVSIDSLGMAYAAAKSDKIHTDVLTKAREACYKARDAFYACLEKESDKKPTEIASMGLLYPLECKQRRNEYVKQCRSSWVKHFDKQYCQNKRVQTLLNDKGSTRGLLMPPPLHFQTQGVKLYGSPCPLLKEVFSVLEG